VTAASRSAAGPIAARAFAWAVGAVLIATVLALAWLGVRGALAYGHLRSAQSTVSSAMGSMDDPAAAATMLATVGTDTSAARDLTADPVWRVASRLPWIGPQLAAVSQVSSTLDDVATDALEPLGTAASGFTADALRPQDGAFDVARIAALEPAAASAATGLARASAALDAIDERPLLGVVRRPIVAAREVVAKAASSTDALHRATQLLPAMLGADGPRTYLLVFQNNAEWRSLGGIVGATALIATDHGRLSLTAQGAGHDFQEFQGAPVTTLSPELQQIFDTRPARFMQNTTQLPDFTIGAPIARDMWQKVHGGTVNGVVSLDPVALSYLLRATGPVTLPTGDRLTADNAVQLLLDDVYRRYDEPKQQDAFFQSAATAVFQALSAGHADPAALLQALSEAGAQRRLLLWSADAAEQAVTDGTTLQGALPVTDADRTMFGVYLNDGTGSKMDYYMHVDVETAWCAADAAGVRVVLRNDAPDPSTLPEYVTGGGVYGVPVGHAQTSVYVYLPEGSTLAGQRAETGGLPYGLAQGTDRGRPVVKLSVQLAPGQQAAFEVRAETPATSELGAILTPTVNANETPKVGEACGFTE